MNTFDIGTQFVHKAENNDPLYYQDSLMARIEIGFAIFVYYKNLTVSPSPHVYSCSPPVYSWFPASRKFMFLIPSFIVRYILALISTH